MKMPFQVKESNVNVGSEHLTGIRPHKAMVKYGTNMLSLAETHPLFANAQNWIRYKDGPDGLDAARPAITRDVVSVFKGISIEDAIDKYKTTHEGKDVLAYSEWMRSDGNITILRPLPDKRILERLSEKVCRKIDMKTKNVLLDIKDGWNAKYLDRTKGPFGGETVLLSFEDPMLEHALMLPQDGNYQSTYRYPVLFSLENGGRIAYFNPDNKKLEALIEIGHISSIGDSYYKIGLASVAGTEYVEQDYNRLLVTLPGDFSETCGVLTMSVNLKTEVIATVDKLLESASGGAERAIAQA